MWRFHYMVLLGAHRRACLRMLAEDAVAPEDGEMRVKDLKPSSKMVVSSSDDSSSSGRTIDDAEVRGTVIVDMPAVVQSGVNERLEEEVEVGDFFKYPDNADIWKTFSKYKKDLAEKWGHYVINAGFSFRTLVRPDGRIEHYQVSSLDQWKRNIEIGDDEEISYYNGTGVEGAMNALECCPAQLNGNIFEMMRVCEALDKKWRGGDSARQFITDDILKYYKLKYMKGRKRRYLYSDSARLKFFDFEFAGRPWCDHLVMVRGNCMQVPGEPALELLYKNFNESVTNTSSLFDVVSREGTDLNQMFGELGIRKEKRLNSVVPKVQRAHQNRAMATSGSAYDDIIEMHACVEGTSSIRPRRPRGKKVLPLPEQIALAQMTQAETEGFNLKAVEHEVLDLAKHDPIRLDTQIRSSISQLSVGWKSAAEVLKVAAADRVEYEVKKASLDEQLKGRTALCEQLQKEKALWLEQLEHEKTLQKKQFETESAALKEKLRAKDPGSPVPDDTTPEEVVRLRGKGIEMGKALSRARDSINHTQQVYNKLKYERRLHKLNFDSTFKELFELQCRYGKIKIERDEVLRKESDRFVLLQKSLKDKPFVDESDKLECQRSLLSLTLYFEVEVDSERGLKDASLELLTERGIMPETALVKFLVQEARNRHSIEAQRCSARAGGQIVMRILFFNIKKEDRRIQAQLEINLRHACDELERCKGHNVCLEREKVECNKLLQSLDKRVTLLEARLLDAQKRLLMSKSRLKKYLTPKRGKRASNTDHEHVEVENDKVENMRFTKGNEGGGASTSKLRAEESEEEEVKDLLPHTRHKTHPQESRLNAVTVELSYKDAKILTANNEAELWK
ncbi:hypothetical protein GIB67_042331 [Kingdonia uniflora]|uniref:Uncharacterized protein n=1 Tax=Kingdonia uniflora TaxID=39325 RepID=A0A7J7LEB5_9MAGN|nr:hypothetical protein GIB67_042331 [Kingdonia uniflora]